MPVSPHSVATDPVRTAVRFPLRLAIVLNTAEREYNATTVDVSANGICFTADDLPPVDSRVEFRLTMPAAIMGGQDDVTLQCIGRIVRHERSGERNLAAAVIDDYTLKAEHS